MAINIILIALGFALLMFGANALVSGASDIARKYHISEIVIGLTIVSIGTSMPELVVSVTSALEGHSDLSIGNIIGSNLCNLLLILGTTSIISPLVFQKTTKKYDIPILIFATLLFFALANIGNQIATIDGIILIVFFVLFILYTIKIAKQDPKSYESETPTKNVNIFLSILNIIVGIVLLKFGGDISVDNAVEVARKVGLSEKLIGLTIIAIGTSLPELVTSVVAALKKNTDIAIGNVVGSNIFNILLIIGSSAIISGITYTVSYNIEMVILIISTILLLCFAWFGKKDTMTRLNGSVYIFIYILYILNLILS